jgi:CHAD domain-containing protein
MMMTAAAALHRYLAEQRGAFATADEDVRRGESVHDLRVAARRIRAVLVAYRPLLESSRVDGLARELRWAGRELSDLRDAEVLRESIDTVLQAEPGDRCSEPLREVIHRRLNDAEDLLRRRVAAAMHSDRWSALSTALDEIVADPLLLIENESSGDTSDDHILVEHATRTLRRLRRRVETAAVASAATRYVCLHDVRKSAKRMRYALEVIGLDEPKAQQLADEVRAIPSAIGDYLDAVRAASWIEGFAQEPGAREDAFELGRLHGRLDTAVAEQERRANDAITAVFTSHTLELLESHYG